MKVKLPSIPIKEFLAGLGEKLPRLNLSPIMERVPFLQGKINFGLLRKLAWPALGVIVLITLVILGIRFYPAMQAVAMPDEFTELNLTAGQEVILWHAMDDKSSKTLIKLVDEFNASNPWGVTVVPQDQGTYTRLRERLDEAATRGIAPDLVALYPYHAAAYAAQGHVVALDPYLKHTQFGLTRTDLDDFLPGLLDGERNPNFDQLLSFPIAPNAMLLVYNLDWLRSLGYQDPPSTWGVFKEVCKQAVADTNGDGAPETFGYAFVADVPTFSSFVLTRGGELLDKNGDKTLFNTLEGEKAMRIIRETFSSKCAYSVPGRDWDRGEFASAKVIFNIVPSSALPEYHLVVEQTSAFRWSVAPLPYNTASPLTPLYGQSWTIFKTAPERQVAAWLFIRWFAETRQTQRWAQINYTLPLRLSAVSALQNQKDLDPILARVLELAESGQPEPSIAAWESVGQIVVETMRAVAGGMEPKDALDQAEKAANNALQRKAP